MPVYPGSLAVGLPHLPTNASQAERTQARIALALKAASDDYALIETFETNGNAVKDEAAFQSLAELATRLDAEALVHAGGVDLHRIRAIAEHVRMVLVPV